MELKAAGNVVEHATNKDGETITVSIKVKGQCPVGSGPQKEFWATVALEVPRGALRDVPFDSKAALILILNEKL